jgi:hypothetical protein
MVKDQRDHSLLGPAQEEQLTRSTFREAVRVVSHPPFLKKTTGTALLIGLVLFSINHLDEVIRREAVVWAWIKGVLTCLVPFCVANWGIFIATRRPH